MTVIQAIILGLIQGLTEFVPISSSAHLIVVPWLLQWNDPGLSFDIALHLGTLVALALFFAVDWIRLIRAAISSVIERKIGDDPNRKLAWLLVIGSIPGVITGFLFENTIKDLFHQSGAPHTSVAMLTMAVVIIIMGSLLFLAERTARHHRELNRVTLKDSIVIGLFQALAIFPGVSRSGSTITGGLFSGLQREDAARFSFLLAAPIVAGAGLSSLIDIYHQVQSGLMVQTEINLFAIGFVAAAVSGYLCIKFFLRFLQKNSTDIFAYYRWILAVIIIIVVFWRG